MLERVHQETDIQRRRLIYGFPQQVASLRDVAAEFLTEIFRPSRLEARPLLRGVYFTSGTQDGTPIDRLLGAMAGQFGLQRQAVRGVQRRRAQLFPDPPAARGGVRRGRAGQPRPEGGAARTRWIYRAAYAAGALVLLLLGTPRWTGQLHRQPRP